MAGDWFDGNGTGNAVDVTAILSGQALKGVCELVEAGALVSLGTTSDGGALGVTVTVDGRYRREYFRDVDGLLAWVAEAVPAVEAARGTSRPPAAQRPRGRRQRASTSP